MLRNVIGGNQKCYCEHVEDFLNRVRILETTGAGRPAVDPLQLAWGTKAIGPTSGASSGAARGPDVVFDHTKPLELLEPLGTVGQKDKILFDDKVATSPEVQFNGARNGLAWVRKVVNHFISRAPVLLAIL